ncbi:MAG TPA: hypothetical protein VGL34_25805 [Steroidobacteraceae bacterium]|jgi:TPP-dependent pyruvate/acetoin dehydrogenase alpha subunit
MNNQQPDTATRLAMYSKMTLIKLNDEQAMKAIRSGRLIMPYYGRQRSHGRLGGRPRSHQ